MEGQDKRYQLYFAVMLISGFFLFVLPSLAAIAISVAGIFYISVLCLIYKAKKML